MLSITKNHDDALQHSCLFGLSLIPDLMLLLVIYIILLIEANTLQDIINILFSSLA